jgi:CheY-like chemotaxis protein
MHILLVEDDLAIQSLLQRFFEIEGHTLQKTDNGEDAKLLWAKEHFDCVVLDYHLPGISGMNVCQWIRTQPKGKNTYVLINTSDKKHGVLQEMLEVGANDYITKPVNLEFLKLRLEIAEFHVGKQTKGKELAQEPLTHKLTTPLPAECWNNAIPNPITLPRWTKIEINNPYDNERTVITTIEETGTKKSLEINTPQGKINAGYRFIVQNRDLGNAILQNIPKEQKSFLGEVQAYIDGKSNALQIRKIFEEMRKIKERQRADL